MQRFFFISILAYFTISGLCYKYTIKQLEYLLKYKVRHQNQIDFFNTLRIVSFIPILNIFYFVLIIEDILFYKHNSK